MSSLTTFSPLSLPVVNGPQFGLGTVSAVLFDPARGLVYAGGRSFDRARRALAVFPVEGTSMKLGTPRMFSNHPDPLPPNPGGWTLILCLLLDQRFPNKLFMGLNASNLELGEHRPLVVYDLDEKGWPKGTPRAYDIGNPWDVCSSLALHPTLNKLYAVGWGLTGVSIIPLNETGEPIAAPEVHVVGEGTKRSLGFRSDGTRLYLGRFPWTLEVVKLDAYGLPISGADAVRTYPILHAPLPEKYLAIVVRDHAIYWKGPDGTLSYFSLDGDGDPVLPLRSTGINIQSVSTAAFPNRILVGVSNSFKDAITGEIKVDGTIVQELEYYREGETRVVSQSDVLFRKIMSGDPATDLTGMSSMLSGIPAPVIAVEAMTGFLGNRVAGLNVRASLRSITAKTPLTLVSKSVTMSDQAAYLQFAYSANHDMVYASDGHAIRVYSISGGAASAVIAVNCEGASGPLAVDDKRSLLYAARSDGALAVRALDDATGIPAADGENLPTGLATIETLCLNPATGQVYVFGRAGARAVPAASAIVSIPITNTKGAVINPDRGRLYACTVYSDHENLCVWNLGDDGRPSDLTPARYADGLPPGDPRGRGMLFAIRVNPNHGKLYVGGYSEKEKAPPWNGAIVVYNLDRFGDPTDPPRAYPSANVMGTVWDIELSNNGNWLYEAGWGDPKVFAWRLNSLGEPEGRPEAGTMGGQGKNKLQTTADGRHLLVGSYPSTLEIVDLTPDGQPVRGASTCLEIGTPIVTRKEDLGLLVPGGDPSKWIDLDRSLRDRVGLELGRLGLPNYPASIEVTQATLQFEVAQADGGEMKPLKSFDIDVTGNTAAIILPCYGLDDLAALPTLIQSSAERYARHSARSVKVDIPPDERPSQFVIANGLVGIDSSPEAMRAGVEAIGRLGHNTIEVWNFPGVSAEAIRSAVEAAGIRRFRVAIYGPPAYFDFYSQAMQPDNLAGWASGFRDRLVAMGADGSELPLFHMADEPGWYFPYMYDQVRQEPDGLAVFRTYLQAKGLTPHLLGHSTWDTVEPVGLNAATGPAASLPAKRLFFWSTRFFAESLSKAFAAASASLRANLNPDLLTTTNLNNWPGRYFIPSPYKKIGNNDNLGPDAAMGMPDWFDLGRKRAVSCLWTEDWVPDQDAQLWSLYGDLLRCAAREGDLAYGGYVVGQGLSWSNVRDGATYKIMSLVAHGAKAVELYIFGEILAFGDSWSENYYVYQPLTDALRLLARGERLLYPGRPRTGTVALLLPQASQVWDPDAEERYYLRELYGLHAALIHDQYPVDFVDDFGVEDDQLTTYAYKVLYVSAPNLSARAQERILRWVRAGGTLVLLPGACAADEYNQPTGILSTAIGATRPPVIREAVPHPRTAQLRTQQLIERKDDSFPVSHISTFYQTTPLTPVPGAGRPIANFLEGSAVVASQVDRGRVITFGYWPGTTYWYSPDRSNPSRLPDGWSAEARAIIAMPARDANAPRHVSVSAAGVEAALLESEEGIALTLLNWFAIPLDDLIVTVHRPRRTKLAEVKSLRYGDLGCNVTTEGLRVKLPRLETVDVIMFSYSQDLEQDRWRVRGNLVVTKPDGSEITLTVEGTAAREERS